MTCGKDLDFNRKKTNVPVRTLEPQQEAVQIHLNFSLVPASYLNVPVLCTRGI